MNKRILMVVTSHGDIAGEPTTGVWFSEFSEPFAVFRDAGLDVTVASPKGGPAPVDPRGYPSAGEIADVRDALERLNATRPLSAMNEAGFDGIFMPGGHGPMFDLATDATAKALIAAFWQAGKPVGAVCHGPAALLDVPLEDGTLLAGRRVTGFTQGEDAADALFAHMPFSLQERMSAEGGNFVEQPPRSVHTETDGNLVTGQNPASALATARAFLAVLDPTA
ncbi:type 1 glutamine amidotransferase domain-containing protein [Sphingomonas koreensis]|nr:type 1 glutamine amidotransferase domain-containing protein [Sphingomonas koreensis]